MFSSRNKWVSEPSICFPPLGPLVCLPFDDFPVRHGLCLIKGRSVMYCERLHHTSAVVLLLVASFRKPRTSQQTQTRQTKPFYRGHPLWYQHCLGLIGFQRHSIQSSGFQTWNLCLLVVTEFRTRKTSSRNSKGGWRDFESREAERTVITI